MERELSLLGTCSLTSHIPTPIHTHDAASTSDNVERFLPIHLPHTYPRYMTHTPTDIVERFYLMVFLSIIAIRNLREINFAWY